MFTKDSSVLSSQSRISVSVNVVIMCAPYWSESSRIPLQLGLFFISSSILSMALVSIASRVVRGVAPVVIAPVVTACQYSSLIFVDSFISFVFDLYTSLGACVVKCRAVHDAVLCLRCKACLHSVQSVRYTGAVPVDEA